MIIKDKIIVTINSNNINHFKSKGYCDIKTKDEIEINVSDLSEGSHQEIHVRCDYCPNERMLVYKKYIQNIKKRNKYSCVKCKNNKTKLTNLENIGVENQFQSIEVQEKIKKKNIELYGHEYPMHNDDIKLKYVKTRFNQDELKPKIIRIARLKAPKKEKIYKEKIEKVYKIKICENCKEEFTNKTKHAYIIKTCSKKCAIELTSSKKIGIKRVNSIIECKCCGEKFDGGIHYKIKKYCSLDCKIKMTYNEENIKIRNEKTKLTNLDRYGLEHTSKRLEFSEKFKKTVKDRRNDIESHSKMIKKYQDSSKLRILKRLDLNLDKVIKKLEKFDIIFLNPEKYIGISSTEIIDNDKKRVLNNYEFKHLKCDSIFISNLDHYNLNYGVNTMCKKCFPPENTSKIQLKVKEYFKEINYENYSFNNRLELNGVEMDFYIPEFRFGIEVNGNYYHSVKFGRDDNYHSHKSICAEAKNIKLLHFFEDEIKYKFENIKSIINKELNFNQITVDLDDCDIKVISINDVESFIDIYGLKIIYENYFDDSINVGFHNQNELISIVSIKNIQDNNYEILYYCTKNNIILNNYIELGIHYINENICDIETLTAYDDCRFIGMDYDRSELVQNGFFMDRYISPSFYKMKTSNLKRYHKIIKDDDLINSIWDCGSFKYIYNF